MRANTTPKIYGADLAAYADGQLQGIWINVLAELEEKDYAIRDYESF
jgi:hypothetical protein